MLLYLVNKLPKQARVFLKETIFRKILHSQLAEKTSQKIVFLSAEKTRNTLTSGALGRDSAEIENIISYKKDALEHFKFISSPSEFQNRVVYPLLVGAISFVAGFFFRSFFNN